MRGGFGPSEACAQVGLVRLTVFHLQVIRDIAARLHPTPMFEIALIAVNRDGATGASGSFDTWTDHVTGEQYPGFPYVEWHQGQDVVIKIAPNALAK